MRADLSGKRLYWEGESDDVELLAPSANRELNSTRARAPANISTGPTLVEALSAPLSGTQTVQVGNRNKTNEKPPQTSPVSPQTAKQNSPGLYISLGVMTTSCLAWTLWLLLLNVTPSSTVNHVMHTTDLDDGSFWLFVDPPLPIYRLAIFGFACMALGYTFVFLKLITKRLGSPRILPASGSFGKINAMARSITEAVSFATNRTGSRHLASAAVLAVSLTSNDSLARKKLNLLIKFVDLAIQTIMLTQISENGSPVVLVGAFTTIIVSNAGSCAVMMSLPIHQTALLENFIDLVLDLLIAVGYPMLAVWYCLSTFKFDRAKLAINHEVFPPGWLEQSAATIADPLQTVIVYEILGSLRISSLLSFFTRMSINLSLGLKLCRTMDLIAHPKQMRAEVYPKRNRLAIGFLLLFTVLLIVYVEESTRTSAAACRPHPECVIHAQRWIVPKDSSFTQCPCLALIDNDFAPKTFAEWTSPNDVTNKVASLAATGDLQIIQITNRKLPQLPEEIRRCSMLRYLSLVYTHTQTLPGWIKELVRLEFIHIEGKAEVGLVYLPDDIFDDMSSLTVLHLGTQLALPRLPSFRGLENLKLFAVSGALSLTELPSFDSLGRLERLVIAIAPLIEILPDFAAVTNLKSFITMDRGTWCCNGFLGLCDLTNPLCGIHPVWGTPAASCLSANFTAPAATLDIAARFAYSICDGLLRPTEAQPPPAKDTMALCNGILYNECKLPGVPQAICYNARFMGIACTASQYPIEMRRRQIQQKVGDPCNPEYEAWLGCK